MDKQILIEEVVKQVMARLHTVQAPAQITPAPADNPQPATEKSGGGYDDPAPPAPTRASIEAGVETGACRVGVPAGPGDPDTLAMCSTVGRYIDHTLLKPEATEEQIVHLCNEARQHGFASVCVNSAWVPLCSQMLSGTDIKVCTVVGFPLGAMSTESKAFETYDAVRKGADEIDMVINVGQLKSGDYRHVLTDIEGVIRAAQGRTVKVILETSALTDEEKMVACILAKAAGADFVKTSTGFGKGGATVGDVSLMRRTVGPQMGVKASGGIRTCADADQMLRAGATRIGASASVAIVKPD